MLRLEKEGIKCFMEEGLLIWGRTGNLPCDMHIEKDQLGKKIQIIMSAK